MKINKFFKKLALLALSILPGFMVGSALSTWILGEGMGTKKEITPNTYIDDVLPNYELDANNYDVYVFPNWMYADYVLSGINNGDTIDASYLDKFDAATLFGEKKKSFSSDTNVSSSDASFFGAWTGVTENKNYTYKHFVADTSITLEDYEQIGDPVCSAKDSKGYGLSFCGWSADVVNVSKLGFMNQGNFHYLSAFDPLSNVDETKLSTNDSYSVDGSSFHNKTVFIYPIYTTGKDYNSSEQQPCVRIHGDTAKKFPELNNDHIFQEEYYFSQDTSQGKYSESYYYYNNLVVKKDSIYYLDFSLIDFSYRPLHVDYDPGSWTAGWYNYQASNGYKLRINTLSSEADANGLYHSADTALFAGTEVGKTANILGEGVYNVIAYIGYSKNVNVSTNTSNAFKDLTKEKRPFLLWQDPSWEDTTYAYFKDGRVQLKFYVKIEKVDEFRVIGKNISLDYENGSSLYKYGNGTYVENGVTNPCVDFEINNVRIDGTQTRKKNTFQYGGKEYGYYSNIFTIVSNAYVLDESDRLKSVSKEEAERHTEDRLSKYATSTKKYFGSDSQYGETQTIFEVGAEVTDFSDLENAPMFKGYHPDSSTGYCKSFLRITEKSSNFYNIFVRAYYVYGSDGALSISKVGIALAPHNKQMARIYIYDGIIVNKNNIVRSEDGFINNDDDFMKKGLIGYIEVKTGTSFNENLEITPVNYVSDTKRTVRDYLTHDGGRRFYEHQTELEFKIGNTIKKNMVLFLKKPLS